MTQPQTPDLREFRLFKRFTMIQFMLMIAGLGIALSLIAHYFQL